VGEKGYQTNAVCGNAQHATYKRKYLRTLLLQPSTEKNENGLLNPLAIARILAWPS
jgi:hypothetical protein